MAHANALNSLAGSLPARVITRADVVAFEELLKAQPNHLTAKDFVTKNHFAPGIYMRETHIPAGYVMTGKIHKYPCLIVIIKGKLRVTIDGKLETITAPYIGLSPAGAKRALETLEYTIFATVHSYNETETDPGKVERYFACDSEQEYQDFLKAQPPCLS